MFKVVLFTFVSILILGCQQEKKAQDTEPARVTEGKYFVGEEPQGHKTQNNHLRRIEMFLNRKEVIISFDDHSTPATMELLDMLQLKNVKAVFFYNTANMDVEDPVIQRIIEDGHILASHNHLHKSASNEYSCSQFASALEKSVVKIEKAYEALGIYDQKGVFFRYPYGANTKCSYQKIQEVSYKLYGQGNNCINYSFWDVDSLDWAFIAEYSKRKRSKSEAVDGIVDNVKAQLQGNKGMAWSGNKLVSHNYAWLKVNESGMILFHDKGNEISRLAAAKFIDWAQAEGYAFKTLDTIEGHTWDDRTCVLKNN